MGTMVGYGCGWPFIPSGRMEEKGGGPWKFIPATTRDSTQPYLEEHPTWCSWPSVSGLAPEAAPEQGPSDGTVFTVALGKPCWALRTSWGEMWVKTAKTCYGTWVPFFFFFPLWALKACSFGLLLFSLQLWHGLRSGRSPGKAGSPFSGFRCLHASATVACNGSSAVHWRIQFGFLLFQLVCSSPVRRGEGTRKDRISFASASHQGMVNSFMTC